MRILEDQGSAPGVGRPTSLNPEGRPLFGAQFVSLLDRGSATVAAGLLAIAGLRFSRTPVFTVRRVFGGKKSNNRCRTISFILHWVKLLHFNRNKYLAKTALYAFLGIYLSHMIDSPALSSSLQDSCLLIYPSESQVDAEKILDHRLHIGVNRLESGLSSCEVYVSSVFLVFGLRIYTTKKIDRTKIQSPGEAVRSYFDSLVKDRTEIWGAPTQDSFDIDSDTGLAAWKTASKYSHLLSVFRHDSVIGSYDQTYDEDPASLVSSDSSGFFGGRSYQKNGKTSKWQ